MGYQANFKRYELKYLLTKEQKNMILQRMDPYMRIDEYGKSTIRNIYYDTDTYRLVRKSIEQPVYKEKLRVRSYRCPNAEDPVYVELKKKYKSVVYKRRVALPRQQAYEWLETGQNLSEKNQITEEINYFADFYQSLHPVVFLSYEREAYYSLDQSDFRVTFDENILARDRKLSLEEDVWGEALLSENQVLMEVKTSGGIPLWMTEALTELRIYKTTFSKYGTTYKNIILPKFIGGFTNVK